MSRWKGNVNNCDTLIFDSAGDNNILLENIRRSSSLCLCWVRGLEGRGKAFLGNDHSGWILKVQSLTNQQVLARTFQADKYLECAVLLHKHFLSSFNIQAYLTLLCFASPRFTDLFFTNWRLVITLCWASLLLPFFQQLLFTLCLCHILVILTIFQTLLLLYLLQ